MTSYEFEVAAKNAVIDAILSLYDEEYTVRDIHVVWLTHVLGFKKCVLADCGPNTRLYEVTYSPAKDEMYVDVYQKRKNICIGADSFKTTP